MVLVPHGVVPGDDNTDGLARLVAEVLPVYLQHDFPYLFRGRLGGDPVTGQDMSGVALPGIEVLQVHIS